MPVRSQAREFASRGYRVLAFDFAAFTGPDARVEGRWSIAFGPPSGTSARETNVFEVVDRSRRLVSARVAR